MSKPLAIDLFCGLGGWTDGLLAEGYDVIGFDIEQHQYGEHRYPAHLVLQDVTTLHGSQFKDAALIVASPPCQAYSYRAMPWSRAKALPPPDNTLFEACFRIQREASEAAGKHVPLIVENVRGAQKWVGRARWNYGSFYLWGDVPALMPVTFRASKVPGFRFDGSGGSFQTASVEHTGVKVPTGGQLNWSNYGKPGYKAKAFNTSAEQQLRAGGRRTDIGKGARFTSRDCGLEAEGVKQRGSGAAWWDKALDERRKEATAIKNGGDWFGPGANCSSQRRHGSKSSGRKAASAMIAKIPLPLSRYIAATFHPRKTAS